MAAEEEVNVSSVSQSAASSVSQPASTIQLKELNVRSARLASWEVGIFSPEIVQWTVEATGTKKGRSGAVFKCLLVYLQDPSQYVRGEMHMQNQNMEPLKAAMKKFAANKCFRMADVKFKYNTQQEYVHTPLKLIVSMAGTKFENLVAAKEGEFIQPQPSMTLSMCNDLQQNQRFDVTALVEQIDEATPCKNNRVKRRIKLIDQNSDASKVNQTTWCFFSDQPPTKAEASSIDIMMQAMASKIPLTFFALAGKKQTVTHIASKTQEIFSSPKPWVQKPCSLQQMHRLYKLLLLTSAKFLKKQSQHHVIKTLKASKHFAASSEN